MDSHGLVADETVGLEAMGDDAYEPGGEGRKLEELLKESARLREQSAALEQRAAELAAQVAELARRQQDLLELERGDGGE
jgi:hypothetical protein